MTESERLAWDSFVEVILNFLENCKVENHIKSIEEMINYFKNVMNIKVHYLHNHIISHIILET